MVEASFNISFHNPEVFILCRDPTLTDPNAVHRAPSGTETVGAVQKIALPDGFEQQFEHHLHHPVFQGRDTQWTLFPVRFRYPAPFYWLWAIRPLFEFSLKCLNEGGFLLFFFEVASADFIYACCAAARI